MRSGTERRERGPDSWEAQQHRQLKPLRDILQHAWEHMTQLGPVIKREPSRRIRNGWADLTIHQARLFFQPVFGRLSFPQARVKGPSRSSRWVRRGGQYKDLDYPSEDALGPQYCLQYSESPRKPPMRSRIKAEPLDWQTPDVKPQVNPWAQYAGPSPFLPRPKTSPSIYTYKALGRVVTDGKVRLKEGFKTPGATPTFKLIRQEPHRVSQTTTFTSPQIKTELSPDENDPFIKQTQRQLIASSKRTSQSDGVEERPLKRARGFEYQSSQNSTKYQPAASVEEGVEEGEISDIPGHETNAYGSGSDALGGHRLGSAFHVTPAS